MNQSTSKLKVCIVNYEEGRNKGILSKFSYKLVEELRKLDVDAYLSDKPDPKANVNHHLNYLPYKHKNSSKTINTLMVTHIFQGYKLDALRLGMKTADMGICMSPQTEHWLTINKELPKGKFTSVLPAHDGKPRRHQVVAILTNVYPDGCKRAEMFTALCKTIDYNKWAFRIMGTGWSDILVPLVADGLQVDLFNDFEPELHQKILETSDYALYFGQDEGSMGLLDAVNAGVKTIGTPQGFHLDMGLDYSFNTQKELNDIFKRITPKNRVADWTWDRYASAHLTIWNSLLLKKNGKKI